MYLLRWLKKNKGIVIVLALYLAVSFVLLMSWKDVVPLSGPDSPSYLDTARYLRKAHFFSQNGVTPEVFRTPGYPLFIWAITKFTGSLLAISSVQILLSTVALLLMYQVVVRSTRSKLAGCIASGAMLFDFITYWHSQTILSETLFAFMLVLALYCLSHYIVENPNAIQKQSKSKRYGWFLLFSLALNYALFVRPILSYFNALFCVAVLVLSFAKKMPWRHALTFVLIFLLVYCGWSYRNYVHTQVFVYSTVRDVNLLFWDAAFLVERVESAPASQLYYGVYRMEEIFWEQMRNRPMDHLTEAQLAKLYAQVGSAYIAEHFGQYIVQNISGAVRILVSPGGHLLDMVIPNATISKLLSWLYAGFLLLVHGLYALGYALKFFKHKQKPSAIDVFIFLLLGYHLAAGASLGFARFRLPFFPLQLVAIGLNWPLIAKALPRRFRSEVAG